MWIKLTRPSGKPVLVDFSKVILVDGGSSGTKLSYSSLTRDSKGAETFKGTLVKETVDEISKKLRAK